MNKICTKVCDFCVLNLNIYVCHSKTMYHPKYVQIIIHINHNMEFMQFLYKPMKIGFSTKVIETYEAY
jgi:hypothetical protein